MAVDEPRERAGREREDVRPERILPAAWLLLSLIALLSLCMGGFSFRVRGFSFGWGRSAAVVGWLSATSAMWLAARRLRTTFAELLAGGSYWMPLVPAAAVVLLLASDLRRYEWFFFLDPRAALWLVLLTPVCIVVLETARRRNLLRFLLTLLLVAAQILLVASLWKTTGGQPIYRDDHPSFLYRFWLTAKAFPHIYFYNPFWNGGYLGHELISTGALAMGWLALPLVALVGVEKAYLPFLAGVFIVGFPWAAWAVVRSLKLPRFAAWAAALLTLGANRLFFLNLLTYGTTPSLLISFLMVAVWALLYGAVERQATGAARWLIMTAALSLMMFYPGTAMILFPVGVCLLLGAGRLNRGSLLFLGLAALVLACLNGPVIYRYVTQPRFAEFMTHEAVRDAPFSTARAAESLANGLRHTNPFILAAGFLGLLWPARRRDLRWLLPPVLLFMAGIALGPQLRPNLQLHRMVIPLSFFLLVPAASFLGRATSGAGAPSVLARGVTAAAVVMTVLTAAQLYRGRGREHFITMTPEVRDMVAWIRANVPEDGRLFFAGPGVHGYSAGHVSWLQAATGRSMIAGDFYHFDPRLVDYNPVPPAFRDSPKRLLDYFRLMGVTHVVTYQKAWKEALGKRKGITLEKQFGRKSIYRTGVAPGFVQKGRGRVLPAINRLEVSLEQDDPEVVLRFLWQPGLEAKAPVTLRPVEVAPGVTFIGARPEGARKFTIRYRP